MTSTPDFLLVIYLRGGADGLTFLPPYGDSTYQTRTHTRLHPPGSGVGPEALALVPANGVHPDLGLSPALKPLSELYLMGRLSFVQSVGSKDETRSHFSQQYYTETGSLSDSPHQDPTGIWTRFFNAVPAPYGGMPRGISLTTTLVDSFRQSGAAAPVPNPLKYRFPGKAPFKTKRESILDTRYADYDLADWDEVAQATAYVAMKDSIAAVDTMISPLPPTSLYTGSAFGTQMAYAAQFARAPLGPQIVHVDLGGWDTHAQQGVAPSIDGGTLFGKMEDLAKNLSAFLKDVETGMSRRVTVLVMTEFGRSVHENDSRGTDHGRGGVAIVAGDALQQDSASVPTGKVVADKTAFEELALGNDLPVGIDIRDLQAEILTKRMGLGPAGSADFGEVFNSGDYTFTDRNLLKPI